MGGGGGWSSERGPLETAPISIRGEGMELLAVPAGKNRPDNHTSLSTLPPALALQECLTTSLGLAWGVTRASLEWCDCPMLHH